MKAGIISAGIGERLKREGINTPKPLIEISGKPLIRRAIEAAAHAGIDYIACIINGIEKEVEEYLRSEKWPVRLELVVKTTSSSMESLFNLSPFLDEPFLLLTVDSVYPYDVLKGFLDKARDMDADGALAITGYVDDEKPLWVKLDEEKRITAIGDKAIPSDYITAGFYYFRPNIFELIDEARKRGLKALRYFLELLIDRGYRIYGIPIPKVIDVDHREDIKKAEALLNEDTWNL